MSFPVTLRFKPSRRLWAALFFSHALSLIAIGMLALGVWASVLALIVLSLSLVGVWRMIETPVVVLQDDGGVLWQLEDGNEALGLLVSGTAFSWLVVLRLRFEPATGGKSVRVLVALADSLPAYDFRQLQVWSRWVASVRRSVQDAEGS
ncbi:MAG: hypothetical protein IPO00_12885 [Betaproteobacteria bacterium]|nr:hypothetical protein [Betaproteobacteria bacterium]